MTRAIGAVANNTIAGIETHTWNLPAARNTVWGQCVSVPQASFVMVLKGLRRLPLVDKRYP